MQVKSRKQRKNKAAAAASNASKNTAQRANTAPPAQRPTQLDAIGVSADDDSFGVVPEGPVKREKRTSASHDKMSAFEYKR